MSDQLSFQGFPDLPSLLQALPGQTCVVLRGHLDVGKHGLATIVMSFMMEVTPQRTRNWRAFRKSEMLERINSHPIHGKNADKILQCFQQLVNDELLVIVPEQAGVNREVEEYVYVSLAYAKFLDKLEKMFY